MGTVQVQPPTAIQIVILLWEDFNYIGYIIYYGLLSSYKTLAQITYWGRGSDVACGSGSRKKAQALKMDTKFNCFCFQIKQCFLGDASGPLSAYTCHMHPGT